MNDSRLPPAAALPELQALPPVQPAGRHHREDPFEIFHRLHRLFRGRYKFVVPLALLGAAAAGFAGYKSAVPRYTSTGMIRIKSNVPFKVYNIENSGFQVNNFARTQANYLLQPRVSEKAFVSDEWKKVLEGKGRQDTQEERHAFRDALRVTTEYDQPEWIYVRFTDIDPKAARTAVKEVINAYVDIFGKDELIADPKLIGELDSKIKAKQLDVDRLRIEIASVGQPHGTADVNDLHQKAVETLQRWDALYEELEIQIKQAEAMATNNAGNPRAVEDLEAAADAIAKVDEQMSRLVDQRAACQTELEALAARGISSPNHRTVQQITGRLEGLKKQINDYARKWLDQRGGVLPDGDAAGPLLAMSPEAIQARKTYLESLKEVREQAQKRATVLNDQRITLEQINERLRRAQQDLSDIQRRHTMLTTESGSQRIDIVSDGDIPFRPSIDNRRKFAVIGAVLGGGLPVAAFLLLGLLDRRYRYSDDAPVGAIKPTLLGILPNLPDNMADPEQAAVAAHCVHQIRTLLQISGAHEDRRVFAVTSPTSGDGKTSLSLSLGLSFASSGSRTCLIDFDMIGGGLTSSLGAKTDEGLLDAIDRGELNGHIRPTSFSRLSLVPVGRNDAQEVNRLSPELVSRVISQAREKFDIVVIDTGPILGSIEASLVTSIADGVIVTIGRGQSRPQVDKALEHLVAVGARLLGVVFNRADPTDFRRAVSSASVRSVPNQSATVRNGTLPALPFGPMARTVASQFSGPGPEAE